MADNENITLVTAQSGVKVELKPFITGFQKDHIDDAFLEDMSISSGDGQQTQKIPAIKSRERMKRAIEAVVISVDGSTENVPDAIGALDARDAEEIKLKVHEIIGDRKKGAAGAAPSPTSSQAS